MIELSARNPKRTAPRAGCVSSRLWGFRLRRWHESKWTRQRARQHSRTAVQDLFQACRPERRCLLDTGCSFQNRELQRCASQRVTIGWSVGSRKRYRNDRYASILDGWCADPAGGRIIPTQEDPRQRARNFVVLDLLWCAFRQTWLWPTAMNLQGG